MMKGPRGDVPGREESAANGEGAMRTVVVTEKKKPRPPKKWRLAVFCDSSRDKRMRPRGEMVPRLMEGPGGDGPGREEAAANAD